MIHIGLHIGSEYTTISRTPGYNDEKTSRIVLHRGIYVNYMEVISALCRNNDDEKWRFVLNDLDYQSPYIVEHFVGYDSLTDYDKREALGEFIKLVFKTMLANDSELYYNEQNGESNFDICVACPVIQPYDNEETRAELVKFFRDNCGVKPIRICVSESDAAFYNYYNNFNKNNTVLVVDLGSSTIDFTTYSDAKCIKELCWSAYHGVNIMIDRLIEKGYEDEENENGMRMVEAERKKNGQGSADKDLYLRVKNEVEEYFTTQQYKSKLPFVTEVPIRSLVKDWTGGLRAKAFTIELEFDEFDKVISDYKKQLKTIMEFAAKKISGLGVTPTHILLSGGASRMDFVRECAKEIFPKAKIDLDTTPEWVVSDGASKCLEMQCGDKTNINNGGKIIKTINKTDNNRIVMTNFWDAIF